MSRLDARGVESLPVVLVLSVALGALAIGIGSRSMTQTKGLLEEQQDLESFNVLIEQARATSFGGIGGERRFDLDLSGGEILVDGRLVQLRIGDEIRRSEILPLPILSGGRENLKIRSNSYSLALRRAASGYGAVMEGDFFLELEGA